MPIMTQINQSGAQVAAREIMRALSFIQSEQTYSGEIASYQQAAPQIFEYRLSPFLSTYVYDALSYFEPAGSYWQSDILTIVPSSYQTRFVECIRQMRRKIRAFIAWQEGANNTWRFYGRSSGIAPDASTTSCAAMVMLDRPQSSGKNIGLAHVSSIQGLATSEGYFAGALQMSACEPLSPLYFASADAQHRNGLAQSELGSDQLMEKSVDWPAQANALRFLTFVGEDQSWLAAQILSAISTPSIISNIDCPTPLFGLYTIARAWCHCTLPDMELLRSLIVPQVLSQQESAGNFGNTLDTALGICTLQELDYRGTECTSAIEWLVTRIQTQTRWEYDLCCHGSMSSPAYSATLSLLALARHFGGQAQRSLDMVDWVDDYSL